MITRRDWLRLSASASAALALQPRMLAALQDGAIGTKAIPSSGEQIPVIGLGGRWISNRSTPDELADHRAVLHELAAGGIGDAKCCFDSAAGYGGGGSESYAGEWAAEDGFGDDIFWATKVNVAGRGGGSVDRADVVAQIEQSFRRMKRDVIDLDQVHNMGDPPTQLGVAQEYKDQDRIRYIGITTTSKGQYDHLERVMRDDRYSLDFIGIDYAIDNRSAEERIFPLAQDRGIAVMVYLPFGRSRMWQRIGDRELPEWASEFDAHTWAQFMLKFAVAHPAVTLAAPGTGDPEHMIDNLGGGRGRMPNREHVRRMVELVEGLPQAG